MSSIALALKYRPTIFSDLVGQNAVSQTLSLALDSQHISHAYLFSGLRGSGKTSSARIFARALQCESGPTSTPCGTCASCISALQNKHIDIIEMDAASSRGIDDIKRVIEQTKYRPSYGRYKIFIVDEVHMLSKEAFNALLKTLEEPPEFVKFILATTDPLKLPATILSRTQHFRFKQIPHRLIVEHITNILHKEGVSFEPQALEMIARSGSGSLRDTLTLLDQAIIFCKNHIEVASVTDMLGVVDPKVLRDYFDAVLQRDTAKIFAALEILQEYECEMILDEMMLFLKERLLARDVEFQALFVDRFSRILSESKILLNLNTDGAFVLLLCAMKMQEAMKVKDIEAMIEELESEIFQAPKIDKDSAVQIKSISSQDAQNAPAPLSQLSPQMQFENLIAKLKDRNMQLGESFAQNIVFVAFEDQILSWHSRAQGEDKALLKEHYTLIKTFVNEIFGANTTIRQVPMPSESTKSQDSEINTQNVNPTQTPMTHNITQPTDLVDSQKSENTSESVESVKAAITQEMLNAPQKPAVALDAQDAFLQEHRELINAINESIGIKSVIAPRPETIPNDSVSKSDDLQ
ncbi:DNA polymerase III subunit gamma/tau [Helicobacter sp. MIT 05-5293]|uniref:DNA polymerase III subunit gamma/tau n=1 Tax=Helicobacter sp. MIT 05-5293 TaxID=1548149 RepID=UPI0009DFC07D|nr:DNA polymerase III subunit gamma/tau [Helicobacter sp. MIT 05-5293]TLD79942.1 DNA polymerase III subunit gamma/tau [Helicobacter sp. MIT 05-5293]